MYVFHTNTDWLGIEKPIGDVDYYPNGGENQPGCASSIWWSHCIFAPVFVSELMQQKGEEQTILNQKQKECGSEQQAKVNIMYNITELCNLSYITHTSLVLD